MARVVIQNVSKVYVGSRKERVAAVRNVSLEVADKEFMVLVGPSGCGKSTLLRMIAGLEEISEGTISIGDRVVNAVHPKDRDIAMVFQNYALYPHMTVYENMAFGLKLRRVPKAELDRRVREAAETLGLTPYFDRLPKELSGGQRQRVAVGRAIVRDPKAFLFDEPLSNLDAKMRVQMRMEIVRLHRRLGATMIYVTHDQVEAMTMGDRIAVMRDGELQQVADPMTLYRAPANLFVAGFIGSPPMNFLRGIVDERDGRGVVRIVMPSVAGNDVVAVSGDVGRVMKEWRGREVILGVRPEDLQLIPTEAGNGGGVHTGSAVFDGVIDLVEPLGAESYVHFTVGGQAMIARAGGGERWGAPGSLVRAVVDGARACFFDPATELIIQGPGETDEEPVTSKVKQGET